MEYGMEWNRLDWIGLDWIGMEWIYFNFILIFNFYFLLLCFPISNIVFFCLYILAA